MKRPAPRTLRLFTDPAYQAPSHDDVKAVLDLLPCEQKEVAGLTGAKAGRVVSAWIASDDAKSRTHIEYAKWRLLLLEAGLVPPPTPRRKPDKPLRPTRAAKAK